MFFRNDNRRPDEIRPVKIIPDYISTAEGSALIEIGNTRVICTASVEESVPSFLRNSGRGWVSAEYGMLPRATLTRSPREAARGKVGGRTHEIQRLIGRSLRAVTSMEKLGERTILVDCDVIQADGGTRTASITGGFVAMGIAMQKLVQAGTLKAMPLRDFVCAISVGVVEGEVLLDLCYEEDSSADVDMNLVMTGSNRFVEVQASAERQVFDEAQLQTMMGLARKGMESLLARQKAILGELVQAGAK
jgi:ribonuclease PH